MSDVPEVPQAPSVIENTSALVLDHKHLITKESAQQQMRDILVQQGLVFKEKNRPVFMPTVDYARFFPENKQTSVKESYDRMQNYFNGDIIIDHFGRDHEARLKWQHQMTKQYGDLFLTVHYERNLLRSNLLTSAIGDGGLIARRMDSSDGQTVIKAKAQLMNMIRMYELSDYHNRTVEGKIMIVHVMQEELLKFLENISDPEIPPKLIMTA